MIGGDYGRPLDPPDADYDEEEWSEYDAWELDIEPHPGHVFPSPPDETEAALRAADELVESLGDDCDGPFEPSDYEPEPPSLRETWSPAERAELQAKLRGLGVTITELSDARAHCGLTRLSACETTARTLGWHWLRTAQGAAALAAVRAERAELLERFEGLDKAARRDAKRRLGLKYGPKRWRLSELRQAVALARRAA